MGKVELQRKHCDAYLRAWAITIMRRAQAKR
jgi:hypothetical protein